MRKSTALRHIEEASAVLEELFLADEKVLGAFYCGSLADGTHTAYSDIDLVLLVREKDQKAYFRRVPRMLKRTVGLKSAVNEGGQGKEWCCLVTDHYIGLDLPVFTRGDLVPHPKFARIRILKDHRNLLREFRRRSAALRPRVDGARFAQDMQDIKDDQLYVARMVKKGQLLEATGECTRIGEELFHWLANIKGVKYHPPTLRDVTRILTGRELYLFLRTRPKSPTVSDIRDAMKAVWEFTVHVIDKYRRKTGKQVLSSYDEVEFLDLVNEVYLGRRF
jgi:predicted nucleotidyltransferase